MVHTLLNALPSVAPAWELHHVNLPLSRDTADIGRWRPGKLLVLFRAILQVWRLTWRHGRMPLYYVPAPGKRGALYRDWLLLFCCRPASSALILHWHASGLGSWLRHHAHPAERALPRRALGRANVSIVLGEALRADASLLHPLRSTIIRTGIPDPCPAWQLRPPRSGPLNVLFISHCSRAKGVLTAVAGVAEAHRRHPGSVRLTVAGAFPDASTEREFRSVVTRSGASIDHVGFVTDQSKHDLFAFADVLLFPTRYAHEAHPLVVVEALAYDLPVIVSQWRAVAENLPPIYSYSVPTDASAPEAITAALIAVGQSPRPQGAVRQYFLDHYTAQRFAAAVTDVIPSSS